MEEKAMTKKEIYTVEEAAELLNCSKRTILRMIHDGKLKAKKPGRGYIITYQTLEDYLNS